MTLDIIKIGQPYQFAWWITGHETTEDLIEYAEGMKAAIKATQEMDGVLLGPAKTMTLYPGNEGVPEVPDHIHGPDVRLLVTEACVVAYAPNWGKTKSFFTDDLEPDDLERLRKITRKVYAQRYPDRGRLTDAQCSTLINDLGPEAALDTLRENTFDIDRILH